MNLKPLSQKIRLDEKEAKAVYQYLTQNPQPTQQQFFDAILGDRYKGMVWVHASVIYGAENYEFYELINEHEWFMINRCPSFRLTIGDEGQNGLGLFQEFTLDEMLVTETRDPFTINAEHHLENSEAIKSHLEDLPDETWQKLYHDFKAENPDWLEKEEV